MKQCECFFRDKFILLEAIKYINKVQYMKNIKIRTCLSLTIFGPKILAAIMSDQNSIYFL